MPNPYDLLQAAVDDSIHAWIGQHCSPWEPPKGFPEFDPYINGTRLFLTALRWIHPHTGLEMFTNPDKIPINVMSMECREAIAKGSIMDFKW